MKKYLHNLVTDQAIGLRAGVAKAFLLVMSYIFWLIVLVRGWLYNLHILDKYRLNKPVISVGNITLGGVGKTPLTVWIAQYVQSHGKKPAILTRGYSADRSNVSDEVLMLREILPNVPVIVGKHRFREAKKFLKENDVDIFIMDDGFQHRKLQRDLDIIVVDALNPFGNGFMIPRGILREPVNSMRRADLIVLTRTDVAHKRLLAMYDDLQTRFPRKPIIETIHAVKGLSDLRKGFARNIEYLKGRPVVLLSSIGSPKAFEETMIRCSVEAAGHFRYLDHHKYSSEDCRAVNEFCKAQKITDVVMTQKDAVKLKKLTSCFDADVNLLVVAVQIEATKGEEVLVERIDRLLQR